MKIDMTTENNSNMNITGSETRKTKLLTLIIVPILLLLLILFSITSIINKSPTADEITYITCGYHMLRTGDFSINLGHPVHLQMFIAVPLLFLDLELPDHKRPFFGPGEFSLLESWKYSREFVYETNPAKADLIIFFPRLAVIFLSTILGVFIFIMSRKSYGSMGGLFTLFLYVLSPNILAHSRLGNLDVGTMFFFYIAIYFFIYLLRYPNLLRLVLAGVIIGLSLLTKMTAIYLIPVLFLFIIPACFSKSELNVFSLGERLTKPLIAKGFSFIILYAGVMLIAWFLICAGYGFKDMFKPAASYIPGSHTETPVKIDPPQGLKASVKGFVKAVPVPLPGDYFSAFSYQYYHGKRGHRSFLMGKHSRYGWWHYYLIAFLIKVPIPVLIFLILWLALILFRTGIRNLYIEEWYLIISVVSMFIIFSMGRVQIGFRYLLPILPIVYVLLGRLITSENLGKIRTSIPFGLICLWYLWASLSIYPHFLAYFNELAGGPDDGYKYLVDSNLDWGQDLKGLKKYMDDNDIDSIKLSYFGSADASYYGIDYEYLPSNGLKPTGFGEKWWYEEGYKENCEPVQGLIAISATNLQGLLFENRECFSWLEEYEPIAKIGYSIFIYDIPPQ